jgi:uridine kinase
MSDSGRLAVRFSPGAYEAQALPSHPDPQRLKRVMQALPTMSTGYDPLRKDLLYALACFAELLPAARAALPAFLAHRSWPEEETAEAMAALPRVLRDPQTPEEWVVHDVYALETGRGDCLTPMGIHLRTHPGQTPPETATATVSPARLAVLDRLLDRITAGRRDHPLRVAVDGATASGKTTLASELAARLIERDRPAVRASADLFKIPPELRQAAQQSEKNREWPIRRVYDNEALRADLLAPLGPGGDRRYRTATYDGWTKRSLRDRPALTAPTCAVLLVDGAFLMEPELEDLWDFWIHVDVDPDVAIERFVRRDALWTANPEPDAMRKRYRERYQPDETCYAQQVRPREHADAVVHNSDLAGPGLLEPGRRTG